MSGKRNVSVCRGHELANALYVPFNFSCNCANAALSGRVPGLFYLCRTHQGHLEFCENFLEHKNLILQSKTHKLQTEGETNGDHTF